MCWDCKYLRSMTSMSVFEETNWHVIYCDDWSIVLIVLNNLLQEMRVFFTISSVGTLHVQPHVWCDTLITGNSIYLFIFEKVNKFNNQEPLSESKYKLNQAEYNLRKYKSQICSCVILMKCKMRFAMINVVDFIDRS